MRSRLKALWNDEQGQGLTEYALLIALVAIGLILLLTNFSESVGNIFTNATDELGRLPAQQGGGGGGGGGGNGP